MKKDTAMPSYPSDYVDTLQYGARYYLITLAQQRIATYRSSDWYGPLSEIAAIHYLYGAEPSTLHGGNVEKKAKRFDGVIDSSVEPQLSMRAFQKPLTQYCREDVHAYTELKKHGRTNFYPVVTWDTEEAREIREALHAYGVADRYTEWLKKNKRFKRRALTWFKAFKKKHPKTKLRLWTKDEGYVTLHIPTTAKTETPSALPVEEKVVIRKRYHKEIDVYWRFLVGGFCARSPLFPKSLFE